MKNLRNALHSSRLIKFLLFFKSGQWRSEVFIVLASFLISSQEVDMLGQIQPEFIVLSEGEKWPKLASTKAL